MDLLLESFRDHTLYELLKLKIPSNQINSKFIVRNGNEII